MIIGIIGENCTGKSTLAEALKQAFGAEVYSGKDYLRLAKSEGEAAALFREKLRQAAAAGLASQRKRWAVTVCFCRGW